MNPKSQARPTSPSGSTRSPAGRDDTAQSGESSIGEGARNVASEAVQYATDMAGKASQSAQSQFATGKERAADAIGRFAGALRQTGERLAPDEMRQANQYLGRVAGEAERFSDYLRKSSFSQVVGDLENVARREPFLFVGGALVVGLLGGRFLKSASPNRPQGSRDFFARGGAEAAR